MSKRNVRAKSGKQLYLNSVFNKGMLYTASEIPEGYSKIINNLDVTPSGDAVSPRAPFMKTNHNIQGLSKYTYPIRFQGSPDKQYYVNFANVISEEEYAKDILKSDYSQLLTKPSINIYSRSNNALNGNYSLDENNNSGYDPEYQMLNVVLGLDYNKLQVSVEGDRIYEIPTSYNGINSQSAYTPLASYTVIDADTITLNGSENNKVYYRLANINAPEAGYKWYIYGGKLLLNVITAFKNLDILYTNQFRLIEYGKDTYGRSIVDIMFPVHKETINDKDYFSEVSLSSIVLALGLAELDYINNESISFSACLKMQEFAKTNLIRLWYIENVDPYYNGVQNTIVYHNLKSDYDGDYTDLCLEVVSITNERRINYETINCIDKVMMQYVDYMDSYAFIGRVTRNGQLYYKGIIYLTYELVNSIYYFRITLPPNELNGDYVNVANATSNGYNLLNENPINTDNVSDNTMPTSCLGIVTVDPNNSSRVITQSIPGNTIRLRAIMNETYYTVSDIDLFTYKLHYTINGHPIVSNITRDPLYIESSYLKDIDYGVFKLNKLELVYKQYDKDKSYFIEFNKFAQFIFSVNPGDDKITTTDPENIDSSILGIPDAKVTISISSSLVAEGMMKDIVIRLDFASLIFDTLESLDRRETYLSMKWQYANYGEEQFNDLTDFIKSYTIEDGRVVRTVMNNDTKDYKIVKDNSLIFKHITIPVYEVTLGDDSIKCYFQTQESYVVYPLFKVGTAVEYIDKVQLTENINIKDATRIGMFNRQVYLYGPYLKTNTIFFSKFEEPWYFSFPYYSIDTNEKINYCYVWGNNLVLFGETAIWMLVTDGTVNESTLHKIYDNLTVADTDIDLVTTAGNNLIFFNNNNGYIATSSKYYNDPTNISVYRLTDNINNCLNNPKYIYRSLANIPLTQPLTDTIRCNYKIYVDNDYVVIINHMYVGNNHLVIFYRYNQLYKYWSTYSIYTPSIKDITGVYVCEPNIGTQYVVTNGDGFDVLYLDNSSELRKDFGLDDIITTLDTGFLSIDPLNDKRFKDIILDLNHIQTDSVISVFMNFFIDGIPITLSDNNNTAEFEYTPNSTPPEFTEGDYLFKYVLDVNASDPQQQPYGTYISEDDYSIRVQGRNQLRIPVFGKGRLPSIVFKISTDRYYEIVGYSIIYKEKNVNIRR